MTVNGYETPDVPAAAARSGYRRMTGLRMTGSAGQEYEMMYLWRYAADGPAMAFGSQEAAESWLSESYADLLDEGIAAVSLFNDLQAVYGPMALSE